MYLACETIYVRKNGPFSTQIFLTGVLNEQEGAPWPSPESICRNIANKTTDEQNICQG
jgi:hypothetical protein